MASVRGAIDAGDDQRGIRGRTEKHDGPDMLAPEALPEHEHVLGAGGGDEPERHSKALGEGWKESAGHDSLMRAVGRVV